MNLTDDEVLKCLKGSPIFIDDICAVYPATIGEIVDIGYTKFQQYLSILTSNKPLTLPNMDKDVQNVLDEITTFQYLLLMASIDAHMDTLLKLSFRFFTKEDLISFTLDPPQVIFGGEEDGNAMNEDQFKSFQQILKRMYFLDYGEPDIVINDDDDPATKKIKRDMLINREKVRKAKAAKAAKDKSEMQFSDLLASMTLNDCGINLVDVWNMTYYAFHDQLKRMGWRDQFSINQKAALAGAKIDKSQLKHWMRSIASADK